MMAPQNNALERTRRGGAPASRAVVRVSPCRSTQCSTETAGCTPTAKEHGLVPRFSSARSGSPRVPVAGRYGGRLPASALILEGGGAWPGSASVARRHHLLQATVILSNSLSAQQGSGAREWLRLQQNRNATVPQNNGLERTRSRANGLGEPCRSIRCWADLGNGDKPDGDSGGPGHLHDA